MKIAHNLQHWKHYEKLMLENISDVVITTDLQYCILSWNAVAAHFYGVPVQEAIGKKLTELVTLEFEGFTLSEAIQQLETERIWEGEIKITNKYQKIYYFLQTVRFAFDEEGRELGTLVVGRDITQRKEAELNLHKSEQFYRTLIDDALDVTLLLNATGQITFATSSIKRLLGYTKDEVIHTNVFDYVHPDDLTWAFQSFEKEVEEDPDIKSIIIRVRKKKGEWLWCMARGNNLLDVPSINSIAIYLHDDTIRKRASEAVKESEKRFRTLIRDLHTGVLLQDATGKIEMTNGAMCRLFNITEEAITGGRIWELYTDVIHENSQPFLKTERPSYKALQTQQSVKDVVMGIWNNKRKERLWIIANADPVIDEHGTLINIVCSFTNITERKREEEKSLAEKIAHQRQLSQATIDGQEKERLEIGKELHDNVGQQLTTIKLLLDIARSTANTESSEMITAAMKGIAGLIDEVRSISRSLVPPTLKDLGFIDSVMDLIESLHRIQKIKIELDYFDFDEDGLPENKKLTLFRIIQEQLTNIIKHADAAHVYIALRCTETGLLLKISDDGKGFEKGAVKKGLGLTNISNRAELFGGTVDIISAAGKGCTIHVNLPYRQTPIVFE